MISGLVNELQWTGHAQGRLQARLVSDRRWDVAVCGETEEIKLIDSRIKGISGLRFTTYSWTLSQSPVDTTEGVPNPRVTAQSCIMVWTKTELRAAYLG